MAELVAISDHLRAMRYRQFIKETVSMMPARTPWSATVAMLRKVTVELLGAAVL
jgi:hypothetical protein